MRFKYEGRDASGYIVRGVLEAEDAVSATKLVETSGLAVVTVKEQAALTVDLFKPKRVGMKHVLAFSEQLDTLLDAGLPLDRALHVTLGTIESPLLKEVIQGVFVEVEKGRTLADAFSQYPNVFPRMYVNMIRAGEEGGVLPVVLRRLIEFYATSIEFRTFLITSSIYPIVLFLFGIVAVVALAVFVIPKFSSIFAGMNQKMPLAADILIQTGDFLSEYGLYVLGGLALIIVMIYQYIKTPTGKIFWQSFLFGLPIIGKLRLKAQLARVCRTLGTLLSSGVPILAGLRIVQGLSDSIRLNEALDRVQRAVQEGKGVAQPLLNDRLFPRMIGHMAAIGEESGNLDQMLTKVADQYEKDIQKATKSLIALLEPVMIIGMGILIGGIVVSMLTAIFSLNNMPL